MEQRPPDNKYGHVSGAFIFDEAAAARIAALAKGFFGENIERQFELELRDGSKVVSSEVSELSQFPLHHTKDRMNFELTLKSYQTSASYSRRQINVKYDFRDRWTSVYVASDQRVPEIFESVRSFVVGTRAWYSWIFAVQLYWIFLSTWVLSIAFLLVEMAMHRGSISGLALVFTCLPLPLVGVMFLIRKYLFDRAVILFGAEVDRQTRRASLRKSIGLFLFTGLVVTAAAGFFQAFFAHTVMSGGAPPHKLTS